MPQKFFALLLMLSLTGTLTACNTVQGMGKDIEKAGEKTQQAAQSVKNKL
jgi:predicted small secreted protein